MRRREVIALVGAGAVGSAVAIAASSAGHRIGAVISRDRSSARKLARRTKASVWGTTPDQIPLDVTLFVIAVPDPEIASVAALLGAHIHRSRRIRRAFHTSGMETSVLLRPLQKKGVSVCSIHPIRSFPSLSRGRRAVTSLEGDWFGIEGRPTDLRWARGFVRSLGGHAVSVPKSKKTLYHIACTFASNYPLAILRASELFVREAGLEGGLLPLRSLLQGSVRNGLELGPMKALTGPVARGDAGTLRKHREGIRKIVPHLVRLFDELVLFASHEAVRSGRITTSQQRSLRRALR